MDSTSIFGDEKKTICGLALALRLSFVNVIALHFLGNQNISCLKIFVESSTYSATETLQRHLPQIY